MNLGNMEQRTGGIRKQAGELIEQTYQRGFKAGYEEGKGQAWSEEVKKYEIEPDKKKEYIEQGRNEAWKLALHIFRLNQKERKAVFGYDRDTVDVLESMDASKVIEKIREYEEKKHEEDEEIKVGDEVIFVGDIIGIVTHISEIEGFSILWKDGSAGKRKNISDFKKTGRHFPEVAVLMEKMKENKNETERNTQEIDF